MKMDNRRHGIKLLALFLSLSAVFLLGHGCGGGSGGSDSGTIPPPATSVVITGTVPGTVAIAYDYATGMEAARNVASGTPKTFSLSVAPGEYYLMFIENEGTPTQRSFAFRNVTGGNVFTFKANTTLDLGVLVFDNLDGTAKPQIDPISGNGNVTESSAPEASFSPGAGVWTVTRKFVNSTCSGHSPGATASGDVKIAQGFGIVTFTPAGTTGTAIGVANANTAILTASAGALETIYLTMQSDGSLAGTYSKVGYSGGCSEEGTLTAVLSTSPPVPPPATTLTGLSIKGPSSISEYSFAAYAATATWSDGSASAVASAWSVTPQVAEISAGGVLTCPGGVASDQMVTITATYSAGGITETATMDVTITNVLSIATSVVIMGTVPGTVAIAYDYATGMEAARNVASGTPKTFSLRVAPGVYYLMFIANEGTPTQRSFAFRNVTGGNVFTFKENTTLDLGVLDFNNLHFLGSAVPLIDPISGNNNVTESFMPEAIFSPGPGEWIATRKFVNSTCSGHSPGTTVTGNVTIAHGFGLVTYTPAGTTETAGGVANVNTAILTGYSGSALETIYLTMQSDGSLAGTYSRVGGGCSEEGTLTAVLSTSPPPPAATLTGLSISGPSSIPEYGSPTYTATASWSDNPTSTVTPIWSVSSQVAEISTGGMLYCPGGVYPDQTVTVSATYSSGGITKTAAMDVTIIHVWSIPFTLQELSGKAFLEVNSNAEGGYVSRLYKLNADFSLELTSYKNFPDVSGYEIGTWSNDPYGIDLNISGREPFTVQRVAESATGITMLIYDGPGPPSVVTWNEI